MILKRIKAVEDAVVEILLAQFVPEMFLRVEFRRVRRKKHQAQIVGQAEAFAPVSAGIRDVGFRDQVTATPIFNLGAGQPKLDSTATDQSPSRHP